MLGSEGYLDAHVHFWDPSRFDYPWLSSVPELLRPFLPDDLRAAGAAPDGVVAVEADRSTGDALAEARWLSALDRRRWDPPIAGVVGHLPLHDQVAGSAEQVADLASIPRVVGVRRLLQDEPAGFATMPPVVTGVGQLAGTGLTFDLCIRHQQFAEVTELVRRLPEVGFVLDHLGKPEVSPAGLRSWAVQLDRLAALPNVRCKLSGLATEAAPGRRTPRYLLPFLRHALDVFGPSRCMFGSDWPVLSLAMDYERWLDLVREAVADLGGEGRELVMRGTAQAAYGLAAARTGETGETGRTTGTAGTTGTSGTSGTTDVTEAVPGRKGI